MPESVPLRRPTDGRKLLPPLLMRVVVRILSAARGITAIPRLAACAGRGSGARLRGTPYSRSAAKALGLSTLPVCGASARLWVGEKGTLCGASSCEAASATAPPLLAAAAACGGPLAALPPPTDARGAILCTIKAPPIGPACGSRRGDAVSG